jgi:hypothetical protein
MNAAGFLIVAVEDDFVFVVMPIIPSSSYWERIRLSVMRFFRTL